MASLAAAYGFGLVKNHPYRDNKRIGFLAVVMFLEQTVTIWTPPTPKSSLKYGTCRWAVSEEELTDWIREHSAKSKCSGGHINALPLNREAALHMLQISSMCPAARRLQRLFAGVNLEAGL